MLYRLNRNSILQRGGTGVIIMIIFAVLAAATFFFIYRIYFSGAENALEQKQKGEQEVDKAKEDIENKNLEYGTSQEEINSQSGD